MYLQWMQKYSKVTIISFIPVLYTSIHRAFYPSRFMTYLKNDFLKTNISIQYEISMNVLTILLRT